MTVISDILLFTLFFSCFLLFSVIIVMINKGVETMTEEAKQARREYLRRYRQEHPERVRAAQEKYWTKKAVEMRNQGTAVQDPERGEKRKPD